MSTNGGTQQRAVRRHWRVLLLGCALLVVGGGFVLVPDADQFLKINKSIDVFGRVYKEITANYVDEIDPEKFMQAGIDGMLGTLDPYTVYIDKEDGDEVDLLTNGKYGGIGVTIGVRDGALKIITVMDGYSAQRAGIVPGDRLMEVGGVKVGSKKPDEVRNLTRGDPGTEVKLVIERDGEAKPMEFVLIREEIQVKNVTYAGFVDQGIGYIRLERFSRKAGEEVRQAIKELKIKGDVKGIILDLRGNPGGLLDAAVEVVSKFVPHGTVIVSTRGRRAEAARTYQSTEEPLLAAAPLVLLTDRGSASASEIVAGALQDVDRGLIVGTRTFGKGLVQTILPLEFGAQLKITTARYYIPSGRSIQEIDYLHRDKNGVFATVPDSLRRVFKTTHGRKVHEYGGITPDSTVNNEDEGPMVRELMRKSLIFKFANLYARGHGSEPLADVSEALLAEFKKFLEEQNFDFQEETEGKLKDMRQLAERLHYGREIIEELDRLDGSLRKEKLRGFERYKDHIRRELYIELKGRMKGEQARIEASLGGDVQLQVAEALIKDKKAFTKKLGL
jgi:carboxyl-terminal processing protease